MGQALDSRDFGSNRGQVGDASGMFSYEYLASVGGQTGSKFDNAAANDTMKKFGHLNLIQVAQPYYEPNNSKPPTDTVEPSMQMSGIGEPKSETKAGTRAETVAAKPEPAAKPAAKPEPDKTVLNNQSSPAQTVIKHPGGEVEVQYPSGDSETLYPDGKDVYRCANGETDTTLPDHTTLITYPTGEHVITYPDGSVQQYNSKGGLIGEGSAEIV